MADETFEVDLIVDTKLLVDSIGRAIVAGKTFDETVANLKRVIRDLSKNSTADFQVISSEVMRLSNSIKQVRPEQMTAVKQALKEVKVESQETAKSAGFLGGAFGKLGGIIQVAFGITLFGILNKLRRVVDELIERVEQLSRTFFNFNTAIRSLQRIGLNITIAEVEEQVRRLSERFEFFSKRQLREGIAQILLLTRNLKLSKQEMFDLSEATAALAIITGKDFAEEGLLVARAIASGYTEALQRAGIEASRFTIAQEASKRGIDKAFNAMTQAERAAVTLGLVLDQVGNIQSDVGEFSETTAGQMQALRAEWENFADTLSNRASPAIRGIVSALRFLLNGLGEAVNAFLGFSQLAFSTAVAFRVAIERVRAEIVRGNLLAATDFVSIWKEATGEVFAELDTLREGVGEDVPFGEFGTFAPDVDTDAFKDSEEEFEDIVDDWIDAWEDFRERTEQENRDYTRQQVDIWREYFDDLDDINRKEQQRIAEINREFDRKTAEENEKARQEDLEDQDDYLDKLRELEIDRNEDIAKTNRKAADDRQDAEEKFRLNEIQAEREYQEQLLQLREGFLFSLDDALRERDARQVLRLVRRFNLERNQLEREQDEERRQREENFQLELEDIEQRRQRRIREINIEFEQRRAELARERARERQERQKDFEEELEDIEQQRQEKLAELAIEFQQRREQLAIEREREFRDAEIDHQRTLSDLRRRRDDILKELQTRLEAELGLVQTYEQAKRAEILATIQTYVQALQALRQQNVPGNPNITGPQPQPPPPTLPGGFAEGGTLIATKPTTALFGEKGPERVTFEPLTRPGVNTNRMFGDSVPNRVQSGGRMVLQVLLDSGLEARIVDNSINEISEVFIDKFGTR